MEVSILHSNCHSVLAGRGGSETEKTQTGSSVGTDGQKTDRSCQSQQH